MRQVTPTAAIHQRVLVNPPHPRRVWTQGRLRLGRQARRDLAEIFQDPRTRPVQIRAVGENHIDKGIAETGIAAHRHRAWHREQRGRQRIGHLTFHHLRGLTGITRLYNHLHVGQIRQGVQGNMPR